MSKRKKDKYFILEIIKLITGIIFTIISGYFVFLFHYSNQSHNSEINKETLEFEQRLSEIRISNDLYKEKLNLLGKISSGLSSYIPCCLESIRLKKVSLEYDDDIKDSIAYIKRNPELLKFFPFIQDMQFKMLDIMLQNRKEYFRAKSSLLPNLHIANNLYGADTSNRIKAFITAQENLKLYHNKQKEIKLTNIEAYKEEISKLETLANLIINEMASEIKIEGGI